MLLALASDPTRPPGSKQVVRDACGPFCGLRELAPVARFRAEPDTVGSIGARRYDVRPAVSIEVSEGQAVHGALAVVPPDLVERAALPGVDVYRSAQLHVAHDDVRTLVAIQIGDRQAVRRPLGAGKPDRFSELASPAIKDDEGSLEAFIDDRQIGPPVAVEIAGRAHANPGFGCPYLGRGGKVPLAVVPKHDALAAVAMRHEQVERAIAVKIRRYDRGG